jgi:hypothetical protein
MKFKLASTAAIISVAGTAVAAEEKSLNAPPPSPASSPSAGLLNDYLREENSAFKKWDLGGQFRARLEHKEYFASAGTVDFADHGNAENTYYLFREKFHVGYTPMPWLTVFGEARDSSAHSDDREPSPDNDALDLHQGFLKIGDAKTFPLTLKVGRQELLYGDERLIGNGDFNNVPRSFDAIKLRYETGACWVDAFVSQPVIPRDDRFNTSNEHDIFSGIYASTKKLLPKNETQLYFLSRNTDVDSPTFVSKPLVGLPTARDIYTIGGLIKSLPGEFYGWDYDLEAAYQFGRFKSSVTGKSLDQQAFATRVAGGYSWSKSFGAPRVGLEYNFASGDGDATDGKHETFDNLFPTNHKHYGFMDFVSWQNIHDVRFTSSIKPLSKLTLTGDVHGFWLADTGDSFYTVGGAPRKTGGYGIKSGAGNFVGTEIDLIATYAVKPYAILQGGYGHFFVGDYVKDSLSGTGGAKDADWLYAQMTFNF